MRRLRSLSIPPWADRLGLAMLGAWLVAIAGARLFRSVAAFAQHEALGDLGAQVEATVNLFGLMLPSVFIMLGPALWEDPGKRPRFLAACGFADLWLISIVAVKLVGTLPNTTAGLIVEHVQAALLLGAAASLAWTSPRARSLVLVAAATTVGSVALIAVGEQGHWLNWLLRALAVGSIGLALLWPARRRALPHRGGADAVPDAS